MKETETKMSIVVPIYNAETYMRECIDSILSQSFRDIELICIDNASSDASVSIVEEYIKRDQRVVSIQNEKNQGPAYSRNIGLSNARGKYIFFVDADDIVKEGAFQDLYTYMEDFSLDVILFDTDVMDSCNDLEEFSYKAKRTNSYEFVENGKSIFPKLMENGDYDAVVWRQVWSIDFLKKNKIYFAENASPHEDLLFSFQALLTAKRVKVVSVSYYKYRRHMGSTTISTGIAKHLISRFVIYTESLFFSRKIIEDADTKLENAIYTYLASQGKAVCNLIEKYVDSGNNLDDKIFNNNFYEMYFKVFLSEFNSISCNLFLKRILEAVSKNMMIIVYGAGMIGIETTNLLENLKIRNYLIAVTDKKREKKKDIKIYNINELMEYKEKSLVLVATAHRYQSEIIRNLRQLGFSNYICVS